MELNELLSDAEKELAGWRKPTEAEKQAYLPRLQRELTGSETIAIIISALISLLCAGGLAAILSCSPKMTEFFIQKEYGTMLVTFGAVIILCGIMILTISGIAHAYKDKKAYQRALKKVNGDISQYMVALDIQVDPYQDPDRVGFSSYVMAAQ